jgi:hypothetical protein
LLGSPTNAQSDTTGVNTPYLCGCIVASFYTLRHK